ncbi:hypothetical protein D1BOALGB6SA_3014 [Olavius sp. associated proteobacterium Delta 1]|nr:hypothetical protein D1BOALGB6SA_3014 [Olavius sp. associated proteobacterium Delta 1]
MKRYPEKRACERHCYAADIAFSYFNHKHSYNAEILNIGLGGMCFKSYLSLLPGTTICVRLKKNHSNGSCSGSCEGLHLVTLADVKWCHEATGSEAFPYGVGVKYFEPVY